MKRLTLSLFCLLPVGLYGQASTPPAATPAAPANSASVQGQPVQGTPIMPWELLSEQIDFADPGEGTFRWKGRTFNLTSSRAFRARFERYLNESYSPQDADTYRATMNRIQDLLSISRQVDSETLDEAFALLFEAANYEVDGGNSLVLANLVHNAWRARNELSANRLHILQLEEQRDSQRRDLRSSTAGDRRDGIRIDEQLRQSEQPTRVGDAEIRNPVPGSRMTPPPTGTPGNEGITQTQIDARRLLETEVNLETQRRVTELTGVQARLQFQSQLVQLMSQRRFQHALIGVDFYRHIFKSSGQTLEVGKERIAEWIPEGDFVPTVDSLGSLARNVITDVDSGMASVMNAYRDRQMVSALERLQETFFIGEFLPPVQLLDPQIKREFRSLYQNIREVTNLLDLKDFDGVDEIVKQIDQKADDFSAREILAATRTQRTLSNLALNGSRQAGAAGETNKAQELMAQAIGYWPLNPAIQSFSQTAVDMGDARVQARMLFDDSFERGEHRRIYERRIELGMALADDPVRGKQLREIVQNLMAVEGAISQAEEMQKRGLPYQAWEFLTAAREIAPDDGPLNRAVANLAPRVAPLVAKLEVAQRLEEQRDYPASLIQYLAADDVAPTRTAREGVERVTEQILEILTPDVSEEEESGHLLLIPSK